MELAMEVQRSLLLSKVRLYGYPIFCIEAIAQKFMYSWDDHSHTNEIILPVDTV